MTISVVFQNQDVILLFILLVVQIEHSCDSSLLKRKPLNVITDNLVNDIKMTSPMPLVESRVKTIRLL